MLRLVPPKKGRSPFFKVRGSYLGIYIDRSTKSNQRRLAGQILRRWKGQIERGDYRPAAQLGEVVRSTAACSFLEAAVAYMKAGGERKHLGPIIEATGASTLRDKAVDAIDQLVIDNACQEIYPNASAQTKNRQFYTPVIAVLRRSGIKERFARPIGWRGNQATSWLRPEQAFAVFAAADKIDAEFGLFLRTLLYTGMRLSEALGIRLAHLSIGEAMIYLPETKNGKARAVHLPPVLVTALANQQPRPKRLGGRMQQDAGIAFLERHTEARLFRFHAGGHLRDMLTATFKACGLTFPRRQGGFHIFCHTYATWMRRFGSLDTYGLVRTGRWADSRSADRYSHTQASEEARRADLLPAPKRTKRKR